MKINKYFIKHHYSRLILLITFALFHAFPLPGLYRPRVRPLRYLTWGTNSTIGYTYLRLEGRAPLRTTPL